MFVAKKQYATTILSVVVYYSVGRDSACHVSTFEHHRLIIIHFWQKQRKNTQLLDIFAYMQKNEMFLSCEYGFCAENVQYEGFPHCSLTVIFGLSLWAVNSGANMLSMVAVPLRKVPTCVTLRVYSSTWVPLSRWVM